MSWQFPLDSKVFEGMPSRPTSIPWHEPWSLEMEVDAGKDGYGRPYQYHFFL